MASTTQDLTIIATFYGKRAEAGRTGFDARLIKSLCKQFALTPNSDDDWMDKKQKVFLRRFHPAAAHDTSVVQIAIGGAGNTKSIFPSMLKKMEESLSNNDWNSVWGYSLIFLVQPNGRWDEKKAEKIVQETASVTRRLYGDTTGGDLAQADYSGGRLWLMDIPLLGDGKEATSVYLAVCPKNDTQDFIINHLYGSNASLLMPDLIAHKSYYEIRQYRTDEQKAAFDNAVELMVNIAGKVLTNLNGKRSLALTNELAESYAPLLAVNAYLSRLRVSLARQLINFNQWYKSASQNQVLVYHREHIEVAGQELDLMIKEADDALRSCQTTVDIIQTETEKSRDHRQQRFENLLAVFGAILALGQIFNRDLIAELMPNFIPPPPQGYSVLFLDLAQMGLVLSAALILGLVVRWMLGSKK